MASVSSTCCDGTPDLARTNPTVFESVVPLPGGRDHPGWVLLGAVLHGIPPPPACSCPSAGTTRLCCRCSPGLQCTLSGPTWTLMAAPWPLAPRPRRCTASSSTCPVSTAHAAGCPAHRISAGDSHDAPHSCSCELGRAFAVPPLEPGFDDDRSQSLAQEAMLGAVRRHGIPIPSEARTHAVTVATTNNNTTQAPTHPAPPFRRQAHLQRA